MPSDPAPPPMPPGAIPATLMSEAPTAGRPMPPPETNRPRTGQVIGGFLAAAAIIVGGMWTIATTVFVDKETYLREQKEQIEINATLKHAVDKNTDAASRLEKSVDKLDGTVDDLNRKLSELQITRRRR